MTRNKPPKQTPVKNQGTIDYSQSLQGHAGQIQIYQGRIPLPAHLQGMESIVPGCAKQIIDSALADEESKRQDDRSSLDANIAAQQRQLAMAEKQQSIAARSDFIGQLLGGLTMIGFLCGAIYLAIKGHRFESCTLGSVSLAGVVRSYFVRPEKKDKPSKPQKP